MEEIFVIYGVWALLFYLIPIIIFFKKTIIPDSLVKLEGLLLSPVYSDSEQNIVSVDNNFSEYINSKPDLENDNLAVKVLEEMCDNAKNGSKISCEYYIFRFRTMCNSFLYYILLSLQLPLIILLIKNSNYLSPAFFTRIMLLHIIGFILVFILKKFVDGKATLFAQSVYKSWYDKILNFDLITINRLKPAIMNSLNSESSNHLISAANEFSRINEKRCNALLASTQKAIDKMDEFIKLETSKKSITWEKVSTSLETNLDTLNSINLNIFSINQETRDTLKHLLEAVEKNKIDLDAINKITSLLTELLHVFSHYKNETYSAELEHLDNISKTLENLANGALNSIQKTIESNSKNLTASYEEFFGICSKFNDVLDSNYEDRTFQSIRTLGKTFIENLAKIEESNAALSEIINTTTDSTKELCKAAYDFTQYTLSSGFMKRIKRNLEFKKHLEAAASTLISYEKLVELYDNKDKS